MFTRQNLHEKCIEIMICFTIQIFLYHKYIEKNLHEFSIEYIHIYLHIHDQLNLHQLSYQL